MRRISAALGSERLRTTERKNRDGARWRPSGHGRAAGSQRIADQQQPKAAVVRGEPHPMVDPQAQAAQRQALAQLLAMLNQNAGGGMGGGGMMGGM